MELSFLNRSWNEDDLSLYVILKVHSCMEFILLLRPLYETSKLRDSIQIGMLQMESTIKRGCCANVGDVGSVGGVPL